MTSSLQWIQSIYQRWRAAVWEKVSVLIFVLLSVITLLGVELSHGEMEELMSGGIIPILNSLVAIKVALGSWTVVHIHWLSRSFIVART